MELTNRFEVAVPLEQAWSGLLDLATVGPCFPGAKVDKVDGDEFSGSVRVKLGPIALTYAGSARIVEKDAQAHRAVIEATGSAPKSGSTATMLITAVASESGPDRTVVDLTTDLAITGRPAQFGRGVMVEVGNKLIGQFAERVSAQLAAPPATDATDTTSLADSATAPSPRADEVSALGAIPQTPVHAADEPDSLNLLSSVALPTLKRLLPLLAIAIGIVVLVRKCRRGRRAEAATNIAPGEQSRLQDRQPPVRDR